MADQTPKYNSPYQSIDCSYYDVLLANASLKNNVEIRYRDENEVEHTVTDRIEDVYTASKSEYMRLASGLIIRLDHILEVGGEKPEDYNFC